MLSPNKQNLILLKQQRRLTTNGHKLLKEKRNGLIINFLSLSKKGKFLEVKVSDRLEKFFTSYVSITSFIDKSELIRTLTRKPSMSLIIDRQRLSGVYVHNLNMKVSPPERLDLKYPIQSILHNFGDVFRELIELAQIKSNVENLAQEIHKTNRQISNLEQKINSIEANIKYIKNALMEKENYEKSVLMKIFG